MKPIEKKDADEVSGGYQLPYPPQPIDSPPCLPPFPDYPQNPSGPFAVPEPVYTDPTE